MPVTKPTTTAISTFTLLLLGGCADDFRPGTFGPHTNSGIGSDTGNDTDTDTGTGTGTDAGTGTGTGNNTGKDTDDTGNDTDDTGNDTGNDTDDTDPCSTSPDLIWARGFGAPIDQEEGAPFNRGADIIVDGSGNVYVTGGFHGTIDFGGGPLTSAGDDDIYILSLDEEGHHRWSHRFGSEGHDLAHRLALTPDGGIVMVGGTRSASVIEDELAVPATFSGFVLKLASDGTLQENVQIKSSISSRVLDVAADETGNIFAVGGFRGELQMDKPRPSFGDEDQFVIKFDSSLNTLWSWTHGDSGKDLVRGVAVSNDGDVAVTGFISNPEHPDPSGVDVYVAMFGQEQYPKWQDVYFSEPGFLDKGHDLQFLSGGDLVVTGFFSRDINFGGGKMVSKGGQDAFLARLSHAGDQVWATSYGAGGADAAHAIVIDSEDTITIGGRYNDQISFGCDDSPEATAQDLFVASFTDAGEHLWSGFFGGPGNDQTAGLALDDEGNTYLSGWFTGTLNAGNPPPVAADSQDVLVMKLATDK